MLGHLFVRSPICLYCSLACLLRTTCRAYALRCAHSVTCKLTLLTPLLVGKRIIRWLFILCFFIFWTIVHPSFLAHFNFLPSFLPSWVSFSVSSYPLSSFSTPFFHHFLYSFLFTEYGDGGGGGGTPLSGVGMSLPGSNLAPSMHGYKNFIQDGMPSQTNYSQTQNYSSQPQFHSYISRGKYSCLREWALAYVNSFTKLGWNNGRQTHRLTKLLSFFFNLMTGIWHFHVFVCIWV